MNKFHFPLTCFVVILFPLFPDVFGLTLEYALLFFLLSLMGFSFLFVKPSTNLTSITFAIVFLLLTLLSLLLSADYFIIRDFFEISKPILFFMVFLYAKLYCKDIQRTETVIKTFISMYVFLILFSILESKVSIVNELSAIVYKSHREAVQFKAVAGFISPYTFAALLILPVFYYWSRIINGNSFSLSVIGFCFALSALLFTQSRTVLLSFIITFIIWHVVVLKSKWYPNRKLITSFFSVVVFLVLLSLPFIIGFAEENLRYIYSGLKVFFDALSTLDFDTVIYSTPSISNRYEQFVDVLDFQSELPILGAGIVKDIIYPESFYALYLLRYGLLGICIHFYFIYYMYRTSLYIARYYSQSRYKNDRQKFSFFMATCAYAISLPFSYFSSAVSDQVRSGFIFYSILALCYTTKKFISNKKRL